MYNFCTLFDSQYLSRGLALYQSLKETLGRQFQLYIYPFDTICHDILMQLNLPQVTVVPQSTFETADLLAVKEQRTKGEYCWTCTPHIISHALEEFSLSHCIYVDADIYFFHSPALLLSQMRDHDILITEHRFSPRYDQAEKVGRFCVQFLYFTRTQQAQAALTRWKAQCLAWCYDRIEPGRFGDQKYLDAWPGLYNRLHITPHRGAGIAPWNIQQYEVLNLKGRPHIQCLKTQVTTPIIFYHFHAMKFIDQVKLDLGSYQLPKAALSAIYQPYWRQLKSIENGLAQQGIDVNLHGIPVTKKAPSWLSKLKRKVRQTYNIVEF